MGAMIDSLIDWLADLRAALFYRDYRPGNPYDKP